MLPINRYLAPIVTRYLSKIGLGKYVFPYVSEITLLSKNANFNINHPVGKYRLERFGGEKDYLLHFLINLTPESCVLDVGASLGLYSIFSAKIAHQVISIEPDISIYSELSANFKLNSLHNYILVNQALGNENTSLKIYTNGANANSPSFTDLANGLSRSVSVPVIKGDKLLTQLAKTSIHRYPDIYKIDVEGYEMHVLQGLAKTLNSPNRPTHIFLEIHPKFLKAFKVDKKEIYTFLTDRGYQINFQKIRDNEELCHFTYYQNINNPPSNLFSTPKRPPKVDTSKTL
ncbi:MAG: FkbM family methyltransferase [Microgenomates group bacterium]